MGAPLRSEPYIEINDILDSSARTLLNFPGGERSAQRLSELRELGVEGIELCGPERVSGMAVLGKGYCGLLVSGRWQKKTVAIKIRRSDSTHQNLLSEAERQRHANLLEVGPQLYAHSSNILVMERLRGKSIHRWLTEDTLPAQTVKRVLRSLLEQARSLDRGGLDHGALRCVAEHAFVDGQRVTLIDFSNASTHRRAANLTTLVPGLFWGTQLADQLARHIPLPDREELTELLRRYKQEGSEDQFLEILQKIDAGNVQAQGSTASTLR
ncbi:MAG: serine/threonine protein kinase [Desulfuromonas sp.]|nr:MAG: serine/threonine protein kinase [Desulfuromonas sp.]